MSSLVERLRIRTERRPLYNLDESDDDDFLVKPSGSTTQTKVEKIERPDAKGELCQVCGESGELLKCCTCTYAYHSKCLIPPLKGPPPESWSCPECVSPLNEVDKILDCERRPTVADDTDASTLGSKQIFVKQYLVKWKGLSYLHCTWVPEKEFIKAFRSNSRLKTKLNNFNRNSANNSEDEFVAIRPEWTTVDRILASRDNGNETEYFVKWKELQYDECYWEFESDISAFEPEIEKFKKIQARMRKSSAGKPKSYIREAKESRKKSKEFLQFEKTPDFLPGGSLHPYQLEGLNFLRYSWSKQTHVILADEMGLGKTIQSIAFLASLYEEKIVPFLVVAPLSTLRNWEREFATWAPQMNVVMYVGSSQSRAVIREYEFYFPKGEFKKHKKKKAGAVTSDSKQERIKFDVLLTSYEMINMDSASLKPIKWECMIVDEGHRLKNKDSKLFLSLTQYSSNHRVLLTGTPLQNNLDELFMLMHFLDAGKFGSLEDFQEEFKDINQEEQVARLHKMLAPHLLRRVKKDVLKDMPPKKELILRVDLSSKQKEYYKAILTRNYEILTRKGGAQISLINVVMELRKVCCHAYMLDGVEPDIQDDEEAYRQLLDSSGKLQLLDKLMMKLKEQGHRVLIYTQFQHMLDLLEDYCSYKKWLYERIDGKVGGAERQIRIDRFNAQNSSRFCFLLSTRAGGLGINLATADTVVIYDSDWNPHADLQAMARAHRLGQTNKVMIFRLIARATIEERMMQMTKKKMILEHLVVGRLKAQNINQEELDDIIRYGSKELFADESDEAGKARQIHYDDAAIDRLLDRDQIENEEATMDDEEEDGFLKAFKVANFEFIDEVEAAAEEEAKKASMVNKTDSADSKSYWEELLKDRYEEHKIEEFTALGKGKRSRKQMVSVDDDDLAGLEDASSDGDDDFNEADYIDAEMISAGSVPGRKPQLQRKKPRVEGMEPPPLMEGEGKSFKVLGFNQNQRAAFVQILMRYGVGNFDWNEFPPRLKQKTFEEIKEYGSLFLAHIAEDITEAPLFSDGVPKEGLRVQDVLVRIAGLILIKEKLNKLHPGTPLFTEDIMYRFPGLRSGRAWKEEHDIALLHAVLKHGYGRWQTIVDDKDLQMLPVICQEQNLPLLNGFGGVQMPPDTNTANVANPEQTPSVDGTVEAVNIQTNIENAANLPNSHQDYTNTYNFREMQRRLVEFIKKRVFLLEKALNAEYQKVFFGGDTNIKACVTARENFGTGLMDHDGENGQQQSLEVEAHTNEQIPLVDPIGPEEMLAAACDGNRERLDMARLYNEMCKTIASAGEINSGNNYAKPRTEFLPLGAINEEIHRLLSPTEMEAVMSEIDTSVPKEDLSSTEMKCVTSEMDTSVPKEDPPALVVEEEDSVMEEANDSEVEPEGEKKAGVIVLD
ncbi:DNA helicase [Ranunculus cassubicifolius]